MTRERVVTSRYDYLEPLWEEAGARVKYIEATCGDVLTADALEPLKDVFLKHAWGFCAQCVQKEGAQALETYPVLRRILLEWRNDFIAYLSDFACDVQRFFSQLPALLPAGPPGKIARVEGGISDVHDGRFVMLLQFETGEKLLYKPSDLKTKWAWEELLHVLTREAGLTPFFTPKLLQGAAGGFEEYVSYAPVQGEEGFCEYFMRCGFLLGVVYLLRGSDLHGENIIAHNNCPVVVDTEMVCGTVWPELADRNGLSQAWGTDNVLASAMLPFVVPGKAVHHGNAAFTEYLHDSQNLPFDAGGIRTGRHYSPQIESGFFLAYDTILKCKDELEKVGGPLQNFNQVYFRCLLRGTAFYDTLLHFLAVPTFLESEKSFRDQIQKILGGLKDGLWEGKEEAALLALKRQEKQALERGYIPLIVDRAGDAFSCWKPGDLARRRLERMCIADRNRQCRMIAAALKDQFVFDGADFFLPESRSFGGRGDAAPEVNELIERIKKSLRPSMENWMRILSEPQTMGFVTERPGNRFYLYSMDVNFPESLLGIAPSVGAWYALTGDGDAERCLRELAQRLGNRLCENPLRLYGEGLTEGIGGMLRVFTMLRQLTGFTEFKELERQAVSAIVERECRPAIPAPIWAFSLYYGEGASLLALLRAGGAEGGEREEGRRARMVLYADRICTELAEDLDGAGRGLSNGAEGALSVVKASAHYLPERLNRQAGELWAALRRQKERHDPGVCVESGGSRCMARLMAGEYPLELEKMRLTANQSFTWGNAGSLEALLLAGGRLEKSPLRQKTLYFADGILKTIEQGQSQGQGLGGGHIVSVPGDFPFPSFFYGDGGVLYSLLRFIAPERIPSVLAEKIDGFEESGKSFA